MIQRLLEEGLRHHVLGDDDRAVSCWKEILRREPDNVKAKRLIEMVERSRPKAPGATPDRTPSFFTDPGDAEVASEDARGASEGPSRAGPGTADGTGAGPRGAGAGGVGAEAGGRGSERGATDALAPLLESMEDLFGLGDFSGALEAAEKVLAKEPGHPLALDYLAKTRKTLTHLYESKLGSTGARPRVVLRPDEILWLNIDHRAGFVLSQIDGTLTVDELYMLSGMSRMETARILAQLFEDGVIALR